MSQLILKRAELEQKAQEAGHNKEFITFLGKQLFDIDGTDAVSVDHLKRYLDASYNRPKTDFEYECGAEWHDMEVTDFKGTLRALDNFLYELVKTLA